MRGDVVERKVKKEEEKDGKPGYCSDEGGRADKEAAELAFSLAEPF